MTDQADADAVAVVLDWLSTHPESLDLVGGADHFSGIPEAPWPHVVVSQGPGGSLRELRWTQETEVVIGVVGSPTGAPGDAELWRMAMRLARIVADLPEEQQATEETPVVSRVTASGTAYSQPLKTGQRQFALGLLIVLRPPLR